MNVWQTISPYFDKTEKWGNANLMSGLMLLTLYHVRDHVGYPFVIHAGHSSTGHSANSQHYIGNAVDFHISGMIFRDAIVAMENALSDLRISNRVGLGIYLDWNNKGFHLDCRGSQARWGRVKGSYVEYARARSLV